jgi:hypothetical protein
MVIKLQFERLWSGHQACVVHCTFKHMFVHRKVTTPPQCVVEPQPRVLYPPDGDYAGLAESHSLPQKAQDGFNLIDSQVLLAAKWFFLRWSPPGKFPQVLWILRQLSQFTPFDSRGAIYLSSGASVPAAMPTLFTVSPDEGANGIPSSLADHHPLHSHKMEIFERAACNPASCPA